jgi:hypothetical protein
VSWNSAAFELLGITGPPTDAGDARLPAAVREWFAADGDRQLAGLSPNTVAGLPADEHFLAQGFLLLETDSQHCCQWVIRVRDAGDDPAVYLVDPDDYGCASRARYCESFSRYTFVRTWDALLWRADDLLCAFDRPLSTVAIDRLAGLLDPLPQTHGWADNQACDTVHRFQGRCEPTARVAVAQAGAEALWVAVSTASSDAREKIAVAIGLSIEDFT